MFSELLNQLSHKAVNVTIYVKDSTKLYVCDDSVFIANTTSVTVTSYSSLASASARATIVPTSTAQPAVNSKAQFSILRNTDFRLDDVVAAGTFTERETQLIRKGKSTFVAARSSLTLSNIDVKRDSTDLHVNTVFILMTSIESRLVSIKNSKIDLTGTILKTFDPMDAVIEHVQVDSFRLMNGFAFEIDCNYPEADLTNEVVFTDLTMTTSSARTIYEWPYAIYYRGPGNLTCTDCNFEDFYSSYDSRKASVSVSTSNDCQPDDGVTQTLAFTNSRFSLFTNEMPIPLFNGISMNLDNNLHRKIVVRLTNYSLTNFGGSAGPALFAIGTANDEVYISNASFSDFRLSSQLIDLRSFGKVVLSDIRFHDGKSQILLVFEFSSTARRSTWQSN